MRSPTRIVETRFRLRLFANGVSQTLLKLSCDKALVVAFLSAVFPACSSPAPSYISIYTDAGNLNSVADLGVISNDAGQELKTFTAPSNPGANGVYVTISGESNAVTGYAFPPASFADDTYMYDGWQFAIREYIVVVDKITLSENPDTSATDQSMIGGTVASLNGPFVVDLHKGGPINPGQGGTPETSTAIGVLTQQTEGGNAGQPFDPSAAYAFGFSTVPATYDAYNVNLNSDESSDFDYMVQNGYSVLYVGTATWMGDKSTYGCTQTSVESTNSADGGQGYDFSQFPGTVNFRFGFSTPTNYVNCQNFTEPGSGIGGESSPRGIQVSTSEAAIAQVTVHMDHPFWESFAEDSPVHFDQIAAQFVGVSNPEAHTEDMTGVPFYAFTDKNGSPLPWRNCSGSNYTPPGNGQMNFSTVHVPVDPQGTCVQGNCPAIRDYYDYMRYTQSTQGHLNSQGLCYIDRQYPAPAGGS
jgi:hypothetical protein